jgi:hypothetical protein
VFDRGRHVLGLRGPASRVRARRRRDRGGIASEESFSGSAPTTKEIPVGSMPNWFARTKEKGLLDRYHAALKQS